MLAERVESRFEKTRPHYGSGQRYPILLCVAWSSILARHVWYTWFWLVLSGNVVSLYFWCDQVDLHGIWPSIWCFFIECYVHLAFGLIYPFEPAQVCWFHFKPNR